MTRPLGWLVLMLASALAGCPNDLGFPGGGGEEPDPNRDPRGDEDREPEPDPYWCCDPDQGACVCEGYWRCTDGIHGKTCHQSNPALPDGGGEGSWLCEYRDEQIVCTGVTDEHPDAGSNGEWECTEDQASGTTECSRDATDDDFPDGESNVPWDCSYSSEAEMRACREGGGAPDAGDWECWTAADGRTTCVDDEPETPDDGEWDCTQVADHDVCQSDHFPDDGESQDWECEQVAEMVRCENGEGQAPDEGDGVEWDCVWEAGTLVCVDVPDDGEDGGVGPENPDGGDDGACGCVIGTSRVCDEPAYCRFGEQRCVDAGGGATSWGACSETGIPAGCEPGGAFAEDYWWDYRGGFWDGDETRDADPDGDGRILMPPDWWYNAAGEDCSIRIGRCVQDMWDLDGDGDNQESMGTCDGVDECV